MKSEKTHLQTERTSTRRAEPLPRRSGRSGMRGSRPGTHPLTCRSATAPMNRFGHALNPVRRPSERGYHRLQTEQVMLNWENTSNARFHPSLSFACRLSHCARVFDSASAVSAPRAVCAAQLSLFSENARNYLS